MYVWILLISVWINNANSFVPPAYEINVRDEKFEISSDDEEYDELDAEMIKLENLVEFKSLENDEKKYKPLHSYIKFYNRFVTNPATPQIDEAMDETTPKLSKKEPLYAGFKDSLDKMFASKFKREDAELDKSGTTITFVTEPLKEEEYDYDKFKQEYDEQLEKNKKSGKVFNYTEGEVEESSKDKIKKVVPFRKSKNCTKVGDKTVGCLWDDLRSAKNQSEVGDVLHQTYVATRIWILLYICVAVICWCQRGWCCCCCRCRVCFPNETILEDKAFFVNNPPGILVDVEGDQQPLRYEATILEEDAYKEFARSLKKL